MQRMRNIGAHVEVTGLDQTIAPSPFQLALDRVVTVLTQRLQIGWVEQSIWSVNNRHDVINDHGPVPSTGCPATATPRIALLEVGGEDIPLVCVTTVSEMWSTHLP
jgi:hypothetical protein